MPGVVKLEDKERLAQEEESEAKRLAIMMMKKREKYLYSKIMFGKRRKIREVGSHGVRLQMADRWSGMPSTTHHSPSSQDFPSGTPPHTQIKKKNNGKLL